MPALTRTLTGTIATPEGIPLPDLQVKLFRVALPEHVLLAQCLTKTDGRYSISLELDGLPLLLIGVYEPGETIELARSNRFELNGQDPAIRLEVDVVHYRGVSEYALVTHRLMQMMEETGMDQRQAWVFDTDHMVLVAQKTGMDVSKIDHLFEAMERIIQLIDMEDKHWNGITTRFFSLRRARMQEAVYGMLRQGVSGQSETVFSNTPKEQLVTALQQAIRNNIVHQEPKEEPPLHYTIGDEQFTIDAIANEFIRLRVSAAVNSPGYRNMETLIGCLLQLSGIDTSLQVKLYEAWEASEYKLDFDWTKVKDANGQLLNLPAELSLRLRDHMRVLDLLQEDTVVYKALIARYDLSDPRQLAWLEADDWRQLIATAHPAFTLRECQDAAYNLKDKIGKSMQTAVLLQWLERSPRANCPLAIRFLRDNPGFEFLYSNVNTWIDEHPESIAAIPDKKKVREELNRLQRVFHLPPEWRRPELIVKLLELSLDSGEAIRRIGFPVFKKYFMMTLGGEDPVAAIYKNALRQSNLARLLLSRYSNLFNNISTHVFGEGTINSGLPEIQTLFGATDYQVIGQSASVLSPGAYLVDLLHFLDGIQIQGRNESALSVLLNDRPDIGRLLLNEENTFTELAYVDMVNEILENEVERLGSARNDAGEDVFELSGQVTDAEHGTPVANMRIEFFEKDEYTPDDFLGQAVTDRFGWYRFSFDRTYFMDEDTGAPTVYYRVMPGIDASLKTEFSPVTLQKRATLLHISLRETVTRDSTFIRIYGLLNETEWGPNWDPGLSVKFYLAAEGNCFIGRGRSNFKGFYECTFPYELLLPYAEKQITTLAWEVVNETSELSIATGRLSFTLSATLQLRHDITFTSPKQFFRIYGRVIDMNNHFPGQLGGIEIRGYERDVKQDDLLGITETDATGQFNLLFTESSFKETPWDRLFRLYLQADFEGVRVGQVDLEWKNFNRPGAQPVVSMFCEGFHIHKPEFLKTPFAPRPSESIVLAPGDYFFYVNVVEEKTKLPVKHHYLEFWPCFDFKRGAFEASANPLGTPFYTSNDGWLEVDLKKSAVFTIAQAIDQLNKRFPGLKPTAQELTGPYFFFTGLQSADRKPRDRQNPFQLSANRFDLKPGIHKLVLEAHRTWCFKGTLKDHLTREVLSNYSVEMWDKDIKNDDLISRTKTNERGEFSFDALSEWKDSWRDNWPDIYFRVWKDELQFDIINGPIRETAQKNTREGLHHYDLTIRGLNVYKLKGKALFPFTKIPFTWTPIHLYLEVKANNRKKSILLGSTFTDREGKYGFMFNNQPPGFPVNYPFNPATLRFEVVHKNKVHKFIRQAYLGPVQAAYWGFPGTYENEVDIVQTEYEQYAVKGRLVHEKTGEPLHGYKVEVWDKDAQFDDFLGDAVTGIDGDFLVTFDNRFYYEEGEDRNPNVYFKIFKGKRQFKNTVAKTVAPMIERAQHYELTVYPPENIAISGKRPGLNAVAYEILSKSVFPRHLPFALWDKKVDHYLDVVDLDRESLAQLRLEPYEWKTSRACALAYLGISETERKIITGEKKEIWELYHLPDANALKQLNDLPELLTKSGLDLQAINALLETQYVNPTGKTIDYGYVSKKITLRLSATEYGRLHVMQRLAEKLGWKVNELDQTLRALGVKKISDDTLVKLSRVKKLQERFKLSLAELLVWIAPLDTRAYGETVSGFQRFIERGKGIGAGIDESFFALNEDRTELADAKRRFTRDRGREDKALFLRLTACYQLGEEELRSLVGQELPDALINLANLSQLYRVPRFVNALGLSFVEYTIVKDVLGIEPFRKKPGMEPSLQQLEIFLERYDAARQQGFTWTELQGLLRRASETAPPINPLPVPAGRTVSQNQLELEEKVRLLYLKLKQDAGNKEAVTSAAMNPLIIQAVATTMKFDVQRVTFLLSFHFLYADGQPAVNLFAALSLEKTENVAEMQHGADYVRVLGQLRKAEFICARLKCSAADLESWNNLVSPDSWYNLASPNNWYPFFDLPAERWPTAYSPELFERWIKTIGHFRKQRKFSSKTFNYARFGCDIVQFAKRTSTAAQVEAKKEEVLVAAAAVLQMTEEDVKWCAGPNCFKWNFPGDYKDMRWFDRLEQVGKALTKIGMSAEALLTLPLEKADETTVLTLLLAVKKQIAAGHWEKINAKIEDELILQQRDALVAYVLAHNAKFKTPDDLYAYFLVDTEMSTGRNTTRIQQAIASVQLLVQRIRMGLEPDIPIAPEQEKEWAWRKNYRVWEANRKIFLYPENWIEPELRNTKTAFFKELEEELLQDEVKQDTVEKVYLNYLQKLVEVARLEISGSFLEKIPEGGACLHLIGRTKDLPHRYFYRKLLNGTTWTPWEKIEIDIEGNHLVPVIYNRRFMLFWATFTEKGRSSGNKFNAGGSPFSADQPVMFHEIRMYYTSYREGRWQPKKASLELLVNKNPYDEFQSETQEKFQYYWIDVQLNEELNFLFRYSDTYIGSFNLPYGDGMLRAFPGGESPKLLVDAEPSFYRRYYLKRRSPGYDALIHPLMGPVIRQSGTRSSLSSNLEAAADKESWWSRPFFYEDQERTFYVQPELNGTSLKFTFRPHYHRYAGLFVKQLSRYGIDGLLKPENTEGIPLVRQQAVTNFFQQYQYGSPLVKEPYPLDTIDFEPGAAYSEYNWELFFHIPLTLALRLTANRQFEQAQQWFHYIFNPMETTGDPSPQRYWKIKPFYEFYTKNKLEDANIAELLKNIQDEKNSIDDQVIAWEADPFQPHAIARLRPIAYMKFVVMKYLDLLIAWGDHLFSQSTTEKVNEATLLYVLARQILGDRPQALERNSTKTLTVEETLEHLDGFSNTLISIEGHFPNISREDQEKADPVGDTDALNSILYFGIPRNDQLLAYWDLVDDRLYKIRHSLSIEGKPQQLAIFDPPIDPGSLAGGIAEDTGSLFSFSLSHYRFDFLLQKAIECCRDVQGIGSALLAAFEKGDAEQLSLVRTQHERALLKLQRDNKRTAIEEIKANGKSLEQAKRMAELRRDHYGALSKNSTEGAQLDHLAVAKWTDVGVGGLQLLSGFMAFIPDLNVGISGAFGSPVVTLTHGGGKIAHGMDLAAKAGQSFSMYLREQAGILGLNAGWDRRQEEWNFTRDSAAEEVKKLDIDIAAMQYRLAMAEHELEVHDKQQEHAEAMEELLKSKFSNVQLYHWMKDRLSTIYFQAYQLALQLARQAERAYEYESGEENAKIIGTNYWGDSFYKGLLSGDLLLHDLRKLETRYFDKNKREFELSRHFQLSLLNPHELLQLRKTGSCTFDIPEIFFDVAYPGHYKRRIKSVSLTIPCITGPYTQVNAKLALLYSRVRKNERMEPYGVYPFQANGDERFIEYTGSAESIFTSTASNDSGLFELNFRDERYLPFERAGAISRWHLELPGHFRQFDYETISDVVLHMNYTALEDGVLKEKVNAHMEKGLNEALKHYAAEGNGLQGLFSFKAHFPNHLHQLLSETSENSRQTVLEITRRHFSHFLSKNELQVKGVTLFIKPTEGSALVANTLKFKLGEEGKTVFLSTQVMKNELLYPYAAFKDDLDGNPCRKWVIGVSGEGVPAFNAKEVDDLLVLFDFSLVTD